MTTTELIYDLVCGFIGLTIGTVVIVLIGAWVVYVGTRTLDALEWLKIKYGRWSYMRMLNK